jgi:PAS domain S-box-containing protein
MNRDSGRPASEPSTDTLLQGLEDFAVVTLDPEGRIVQWSTGAEKTFAYQPAEVLGHSFDLLFTPEDQAAGAPAREMNTAASSGMSEDQRWHVRKNGTRIWVSGTIRAVRDESGVLTGFSKVACDITGQKLTELQREALLAREQMARTQAEQMWKYLEEISENIPAVVGLVRLPEQVYVFANRKLRQLVGDGSLVGRTLRSAHPEINPEFFHIVDEVAATGRGYSGAEYPLPLRYGAEQKERFLDLVLEPMRSDAGQYEAILIFGAEVTELARARQASEQLSRELEAERDRLRNEIAERKRGEVLARQRAATAEEQASMLNLAQDAIMSLSLVGDVEFWNRGAEEMYGWSRPEAIGQNVHELLHTEFPRPFQEIYDVLLAEGHWAGELKHRCRDGRQLDIWTRWALRRREDVPCGWLEITRDLTERKRMEAQMREAQKLESLGVLAGGIAHDFNNLLTGILGNISLALEMGVAGSPVRDLLANALRASEAAALLTKQMLAYAGIGPFVLAPCDLSKAVREAVRLVRSSIHGNVQVELSLSDHLPSIQADETQLRQIAMNLVLNASQAVGGPDGKILVRTATQTIESEAAAASAASYDVGHPQPGHYVVLEVRDSGAGIDTSVRAKIFDPFFTTKFTGRGLGLAAVSGIVRALNGAVQVETHAGDGTTFRVLFPAPRAPGLAAGPVSGPGYPILVVDDEEIIRQTAETILRARGYEVLLAEDGHQAVELFRKAEGRIALVLLDMTMPVTSGEMVFRQLKEIGSEVPVIVSSGYSEQEAVRRFGGLGVADFIQKPYTVTRLIEKVTRVLATSTP